MLYHFEYVNVCVVPNLTEYFICSVEVHLDTLDLRRQVQCISERTPRYFTEVVEICLFSSNLILKKLVSLQFGLQNTYFSAFREL